VHRNRSALGAAVVSSECGDEDRSRKSSRKTLTPREDLLECRFFAARS
jgi:hypothetical protein